MTINFTRHTEIYHVMFHMSYGKLRRDRLLKLMKDSECKRIYVNYRCQLQTKHDPDLKYLIKKGVLKQSRINVTMWSRMQTVLTLV